MATFLPSAELTEKLKKLIAKIDNLEESITVNKVDDHWAFLTFRYLLDLVSGSIVGKFSSDILDKYVSNLFLKKFSGKLAQ